MQTLVALDQLAPTVIRNAQKADMRGILDDALNDLHAGWLLEHLQPTTNEPPLLTSLPALKTERSPDGFVQLAQASLAQPTTTLKALLVWDTPWQGLNWLAGSEIGVTFLTNVIQKANQEGFVADTISFIARIEPPNVRACLFGACRKPLTNQLYQTWSSNDQENNQFKDLIEKVAHYVYTMHDPTPIAMLGEAQDSLDPQQLYILLQTCFELWQQLQTHAQTERSTISRWLDFMLQRSNLTLSPALTESVATLRTVWMASIAHLRAQRQQLSESCTGSFSERLNKTRILFQQASQAYPNLFKELTDLDEFILLALQLTFLHANHSDWAENMATIWNDYQTLLIPHTKKSQQPAKHFNDFLLPQAVSELQQNGQIDDQQIKAKVEAARGKWQGARGRGQGARGM